jgi:branched-chain amino acid transport system ATP-binding protein
VGARLVTCYTLSAAVAGIAGAIWAQANAYVNLGTLGLDRAATVLIMLALGGCGRLDGAFVGAVADMALSHCLAKIYPTAWQLGLGLLLVVIALFARHGILGIGEALWRFLRTPREAPCVPPCSRPALSAETSARLPPRATSTFSTTLHTGTVRLAGERLNRMPVFRRALKGLGFVPQEREICPSRSVRENLGVGARPGEWTQERVLELFPHLQARLANRGHELSGGAQPMLSIARALLTNPSGLLMDEPTEGLAPVLVEALTGVLLRLRGESALSTVLVEQNSRVALAFSARIVVMAKGCIVDDGESAALSADPARLAQRIGVAA